MDDERSSPEKLNGQWIGTYGGTTDGAIHVNIDEDESNYSGVAYLFNNNPELPPVVAYFTSPKKDREFSFRTNLIQAIDVRTSKVVPWKDIEANYPKETAFSTYADVRGSCSEDALTLEWATDVGVTGGCVLPRSRASQPSELVSLEQDWEAYKLYGIERASRRPLFRGQNKPHRLRTPFHRSGRADMHKFVLKDIPELKRHLSARTKHVFDLDDNQEYGAFINLAQHHGYPTPVLDWTYSPYVAAFFAYRGIKNDEAAKADPKTRVRILIFDSTAWVQNLQAVTYLLDPKLYVTVREFDAIENERMIPQQAASTVSNIDDIETYIRRRETDSIKYLHAVDLPVRERKHVMLELKYMGITAGSLFPGLDGACEELAERNFEF